MTSAPASGDTYRTGEQIVVTVTFSEPVTVTGEVRVKLQVGDRHRWARYQSSDQNGARLTFAYTVKASDLDTDGVSLKKNVVGLNGGSITDAEGNAAKLKHAAATDQSQHKVGDAPVVEASSVTTIAVVRRESETPPANQVVATKPDTPANFSAMGGNRYAALSWADPSDSTITKYQVWYRPTSENSGGSGWRDIPNSGPRTTTHKVTGLTNGVEWTFWLRAVNNIGASEAGVAHATPEPIAVMATVLPAQPSGLIVWGGIRTLHLSWDDPNDPTIFKYQYAVNPPNVNAWKDIPGSNTDTTFYDIGGLINGQSYTLRIRAVNSMGAGPATTLPSGGGWKPGFPTADGKTVLGVDVWNFRPEAWPGAIRVRWSVQNYKLCGYRVEWREVGETWWQRSHEWMSNSSSPNYFIRGLKSNTEYEVRVFIVSDKWAIPDEQAFDTRKITTE